MGSLTLIDTVLIGVAVFCVVKIMNSWRGRPPLPPGPRGYPLIGNLLDMPPPDSQAWLKYAEMGEKYGPISSLTVLGQTVIVVNDARIANDLLDKRGTIYSGRPETTMFNISGFSRSTIFTSYSDRFKSGRKILARSLGTTNSVRKYTDAVSKQSGALIQRLLSASSNLWEDVEWATASSLFKIAYGYTTRDHDDPFLAGIVKLHERVAELLVPGRFIVDVLPFLQHLPKWIPAPNNFREFAKECEIIQREAVDLPMKWVADTMAKGEQINSYVSDLLAQDLPEMEHGVIKWTAGDFYTAGTETTKTAILSYMLACMKWPHVQEKIHKEIDTVIGRGRLPSFEDQALLSYTVAVCKESTRWLTAVPMSLPHRSMAEDVYEGYYIPNNSIIFTNLWKLCHDPETYKDPFTFNPERFLGPNPEQDPAAYIFGFGRRACPGTYLANLLLFTNISQIAATLSFTKAKDANGNEIEPLVEQMTALVGQPKPFECSIQPRFQGVGDLVEGTLAS